MISKYENLKNSGLNYLGEIPSHWKVVKLKYIGDSITGITYSPNDIVYENGDESKLVLRSSNIQNGKLSLDNNVFVDKTISDKYLARKGDILICSRNGSRALIGKNIKIDDKLEGQTWGAFMTVFRTDHSNFVYYFFNSPIFTALSSLFLTSTINQLTIGVINNFTLALPPKEEQTKIAQYLDHQTKLIDSIIEKKQQLIEKLKEQRQAIINEAVTKGLDLNALTKDSGVEWLGEIPEHWKVVKLKWISQIYAGGTPSKNIHKYWENGTIPWLNSGSVNDKRINKPSTYITEEALNNSSAKWIRKGALVMALAGQGKTKGTVALLEIDTTCNQSMAAIDLDPKIVDNEFIYYWLESNYYRIRGLAGTEQRDGLNLQIIGNIFCPIPSIQEQSAISQKINEKATKIDQLQSNINFQIKKLMRFRQSIISEAVTGKIDVREWGPKTAETV